MLLFIYILFGTLCTTAPVSIHLMLLFISKHFHIYQIFYKFQYISCYSLSCFSRRSVIFHIPFQYISCYSLSGGHFVYFSVYLCFNTSHVTLYLLRREYKKRGAERFNTSHVTLYLVRRPYQKRGQEFQYISCYSLSITPCINKVNRKRFQYISCYSLSNNPDSNIENVISFQYISCYSLSRLLWRISSCWGSFNTSHVTLYHKSYLLALVFLRRFNTSHVTLYRCDRGFHFCTKASFQYISCYSLSSSGVTVTSSSTCFNTSHVTLYLPEPFLQSLG